MSKLPRVLKSATRVGKQSQPDASLPESPSYLSFGYDAIASVVERSIKRGLSDYSPEKPENHAKTDEHGDITRMSNQQVGQLHQYFVNMHAYLLVQLAKADIDRVAAENSHDVLKKQFIVRNRSDQNKWELDAELAEDEDIKRSRMLVLEKTAYKEMLSALCKGTDNKANLFSREISRRASEKDQR